MLKITLHIHFLGKIPRSQSSVFSVSVVFPNLIKALRFRLKFFDQFLAVEPWWFVSVAQNVLMERRNTKVEIALLFSFEKLSEYCRIEFIPWVMDNENNRKRQTWLQLNLIIFFSTQLVTSRQMLNFIFSV